MSVDSSGTVAGALTRTPLHALHLAYRARMVPFAGFEMPVQYSPGVLKEHLHTRNHTGLFDVSHMGQIALRPKSGKVEDAALALEKLVPGDIANLAAGRQRYTFFTDERGGILDDLMVSNCSDHLRLVVNAARKSTDEEYLRKHLSETCDIERLDHGLIAVQGPKAEAALAKLAPGCAHLCFMDIARLALMGAPCLVARSGYTGEDGFEISTPADVTREIAEGLLEDATVQPIGLGARDSLRLEAGLCLYGADIDEATTPGEAGLSWAIQKARRRGGARAGGFPGAEIVLSQIENSVTHHRVGLRPVGRVPVRAGAMLFADDGASAPIGSVTSGGFSPSLSSPISMGYLPSTHTEPGTMILAEVREKRLPVSVTKLPFIELRYKRK